MATRKKRKKKTSAAQGGAGSKPEARDGAVDAKMSSMAASRAARHREAGDGLGVDPGIMPGAFVALEPYMDKMPKVLRDRTREHVIEHAKAALKPVLRWMMKNGASEQDMDLVENVGPNMLRTIIEKLES